MHLFFRLLLCVGLVEGIGCSTEGNPVVEEPPSFTSPYPSYPAFLPREAADVGGWARSVQTTGTEWVTAVAVDREGDVLVAGHTTGSFYGFSNAGTGTYDVFVIKYSLSSGKLLWIQQVGTSESDLISGLHVTADNGIVLTGVTYGSWKGAVHQGGADAFVMKMNARGTMLWVQQIGTDQWDGVAGVVADQEGSLYVTGSTQGAFANCTNQGGQDVFLWKLSDEGKPLWTKQWGTPAEEESKAIAFHPQTGRILLAGMTLGAWPQNENRGGQDGWVMSLDNQGNSLWQTQLGTFADDRIQALAVDSAGGGVFFGGSSRGDWALEKHTGGWDGLLGHLDASGKLSWVRLLGGGKNDEITSLVVEDSTLWMGGNTRSYTDVGQSIFVASASLQGTFLAFSVFPGSADSRLTSVVSYQHTLLIGGGTFGALGENAPNLGQEDGLVLVYPKSVVATLP